MVKVAEIFKRSEELFYLKSLFIQRPKKIIVLSGPHSSGKTKLIQSCFSQTGQSSILGSYLDARGAKLTEARQGRFAACLFDLHGSWTNYLKKIGHIVVDSAGSIQVKNDPVTVRIQPVLGRLYRELVDKKLHGKGLELQVCLSHFELVCCLVKICPTIENCFCLRSKS